VRACNHQSALPNEQAREKKRNRGPQTVHGATQAQSWKNARPVLELADSGHVGPCGCACAAEPAERDPTKGGEHSWSLLSFLELSKLRRALR
jgi:hypothetical protein